VNVVGLCRAFLAATTCPKSCITISLLPGQQSKAAFSCDGIRPLWVELVLRDVFQRRPFVAKKLYVGNLSYEVTDSDLQTMFAPHGTVQSAQVIMDRDTNRSKGFAFVEMNNDGEAQAAIKALNGQESNGRSLTVNEARPREDRGGSRSGGFGGGARY
jgi:cold-inducible RNA-binding protein